MTTYSPKALIPQAELTDSSNIQTYTESLGAVLDQYVCPTYATRTTRDALNPAPTDGDRCYVTADFRNYTYYNGQWNNQTVWRDQTLQSFTTQASVFVTVNYTCPAFEYAPTVIANIATGSGTAASWSCRTDQFTTTSFRLYLFSAPGVNSTWSSIPVTYIAI